tara:strand:- start:322 stop:462 length:141 start_codon:yes stop_codon:yes gene_type:complete
MPTSPNNFNNNKIVKRHINKKNNQDIKIGIWFIDSTKPKKSKENSL